MNKLLSHVCVVQISWCEHTCWTAAVCQVVYWPRGWSPDVWHSEEQMNHHRRTLVKHTGNVHYSFCNLHYRTHTWIKSCSYRQRDANAEFKYSAQFSVHVLSLSSVQCIDAEAHHSLCITTRSFVSACVSVCVRTRCAVGWTGVCAWSCHVFKPLLVWSQVYTVAATIYESLTHCKL